MDEQRRQEDGDQDGSGTVSAGEGESHELALVAELGKEDDSE